MARPKKQIAAQQVAKLARLGASVDEIADFFSVDPSTIHRRFAREMDKGRTELRFRLRRMQLRAAERGSVAMLIWLGKSILGQREKASLQPANIEVIFSESKVDEDGSPEEPARPGNDKG